MHASLQPSPQGMTSLGCKAALGASTHLKHACKPPALTPGHAHLMFYKHTRARSHCMPRMACFTHIRLGEHLASTRHLLATHYLQGSFHSFLAHGWVLLALLGAPLGSGPPLGASSWVPPHLPLHTCTPHQPRGSDVHAPRAGHALVPWKHSGVRG